MSIDAPLFSGVAWPDKLFSTFFKPQMERRNSRKVHLLDGSAVHMKVKKYPFVRA
jgi:hypothetical protein